MKIRPATNVELVRFHEIRLGELRKEIRAARRAIDRAKDSARYHQNAIDRLNRSEGGNE